jgi:hypothetical protein
MKLSYELDHIIIGFDDGSLIYLICWNKDNNNEVKLYTWQLPTFSLSLTSSSSLSIDAILLANISRDHYQEVTILSTHEINLNLGNPLMATHLVVVSGDKVSIIGSQLICNNITPDFQSFSISIKQSSSSSLSLSNLKYKIEKVLFYDTNMFYMSICEKYNVFSGVKEFILTGFTLVLAPAATPRDIITKINHEIYLSLQSNSLKEKLNSLGLEAVGSSPEITTKFIANEIQKWAPVIRSAGLKVD